MVVETTIMLTFVPTLGLSNVNSKDRLMRILKPFWFLIVYRFMANLLVIEIQNRISCNARLKAGLHCRPCLAGFRMLAENVLGQTIFAIFQPIVAIAGKS